jgi:anti-anti-sigma factor
MPSINCSSDGNLKLLGPLDLSTLMNMSEEVDELLENRVVLSVDVSELEFNGSAILALLIHLMAGITSKGNQFALLGVNSRLQDMLNLAGLSDVFDVPSSGLSSDASSGPSS